MCTISFPVLPNYLESVRLNIGFPVVRTVGRGHGNVITKFSRMGRLPHFLARVELRYYFHEVRYMKSSTFRELSLRSPFSKRIDGINFNPLFHYL